MADADYPGLLSTSALICYIVFMIAVGRNLSDGNKRRQEKSDWRTNGGWKSGETVRQK